MRRVLLALLLILGLAPGTWMRQPGKRWNPSITITAAPVPVPPRAALAPHLGSFELEGIWHLTSTYTGFEGYSALLPLPGGRLMAISDYGRGVVFSPPGALPSVPTVAEMIAKGDPSGRDVESATRDPATGTVWSGREDSNAISRYDPGLTRYRTVRPAAMRDWPINRGAEAMVRLSDGRFIVLGELMTGLAESRLHPAVLFARDPLLGGNSFRFAFAGSAEFSPTDMAQLPDGRVLILMRRLVWPFPLHFAGRIMLADPAAIRPGAEWQGIEVAKLTSTLPVDNFEGMAIEPRGDGRVTVWLISDDNHAATQRTLLWKLMLDPARLPQTRKKARG